MSGDRRVTVYSTPFCAPCEALKRELDARNVTYSVCDLMMDEDAADRLYDLGIRGAPALEVDGEVYGSDTLDHDQLERLFK
ncbi:MAG: glutaredoxin family protein [Chromatiales bacterium]|jgi:glutaredoxin-like protein NrdH|nr:glutaredoxin family protein [Chromatiales bacterium]